MTLRFDKLVNQDGWEPVKGWREINPLLEPFVQRTETPNRFWPGGSPTKMSRLRFNLFDGNTRWISVNNKRHRCSGTALDLDTESWSGTLTVGSPFGHDLHPTQNYLDVFLSFPVERDVSTIVRVNYTFDVIGVNFTWTSTDEEPQTSCLVRVKTYPPFVTKRTINVFSEMLANR